ncbi:MAG: helicase-related protein [Armatimonadota bacterium]|nr:hypothetical protein [bacterium]
MSDSSSNRPNPDEVMNTLKDFQRNTVDFVYQRLYEGENPTKRFLVADEVGLGKTMVARGLIAKAVDRLWDTTKRIDVVYVCSNADIARQNLNRLSVGVDHFPLASRLTLLPLRLKDLTDKKLNFISFTPATSLDLGSNLGMMQERALIYHMLRDGWGFRGTAAANVFQGNVSSTSWDWWCNHGIDPEDIDKRLQALFLCDLEEHPEVRHRFDDVCTSFQRRRQHYKNVPAQDRRDRNAVVGELRSILAKSCVNALEPDLIILDEFQRFRHLLNGDDEASQLAQALFQYKDAKVVLLSATPYKMYTLSQEGTEEDHYRDFLGTVRFLLDDEEKSAQFAVLMEQYRRQLQRTSVDDTKGLRTIKCRVEEMLRSVMVRTERLAVSSNRNGMVQDVHRAAGTCTLESDDIRGYAAVDSIARGLQTCDQIEYWKSSPYLLNFMDSYQIKKQFERELASQTGNRRVSDVIISNPDYVLTWDTFLEYRPIKAQNAKLRALMQQYLDTGAWKLLWVPPSLPYYESDGVFADAGVQDVTKSLIFSSWKVVSKVIAALCSYEAERQMVSLGNLGTDYTELRRKRGPLLRFARSEGRLTGMAVLPLLYPCVSLATGIDPLAISKRLAKDGIAPTKELVLSAIEQQVSALLRKATDKRMRRDDGFDDRWAWSSVALLDKAFAENEAGSWLDCNSDTIGWKSTLKTRVDDEDQTSFADHLNLFREWFHNPKDLGSVPEAVVKLVSKLAVASPAVTALRALCRLWPGHNVTSMPEVLTAAARIAMGFRSMFNLPESIALIRGSSEGKPFWEQVLDYCIDGNIQSVMDEYVHVLNESLGLLGSSPEKAAPGIAEVIHDAVAIRTTRLDFDEISLDPTSRLVTTPLVKRSIRCRFALAFGEGKNEEGEDVTREDQVRSAFNSPFRPFILASTSIGQEGLDFHQYCHRIYHWNLPSNPVDMEQREGRIHRYKGHVIRRNLAKTYGLGGLCREWKPFSDPWKTLFSRAVAARHKGDNDLVPFWICEANGGYCIERHVPILPLSRDERRLQNLKSSMALYRLAFGQPRQEDLVEFLRQKLGSDPGEDILVQYRIDLSPPKRPRVR